MVEILAPAGNMENLIASINSGADAVYLGLKDFSARKSASNFDFDELKYAVAYAKTFNVKVYVTVNTLIKEEEINSLISAINTAYSLGVDAFILQDIFLGKYIKSIMPNVCLHLSTQAGVCNVYGAIQAKNYGFDRVILARETKIEDIKEISKIIETEVFIQGALCTCLSGHCYLSSFVGGNSGNRGFCKQPCRKQYTYESGNKTLKSGYLLSLADLSVDDDIKTLALMGVKSFKIEGRLRSTEYVASAVKYYRSILDGQKDLTALEMLKIAFNRGDYTKGLAFGQDDKFISSKIQNNKGLFVGKVVSVNNKSFKFDSNLDFYDGDSFKILRNGYAVASAITTTLNGKLQFLYSGDVRVSDSVHLTKKVDILKNLNVIDKLKEIIVEVSLKVGEQLTFKIEDTLVMSDFNLDPALSKPITKEDVIISLNKTDIYPFKVKVEFKNFDENVFVVKSALNKLRAELYSKYFYQKISKNAYSIEKYEYISNYNNSDSIGKKAVIVSSVCNINFDYDYLIYAPYDYKNLEDVSNLKNVYLYLPPFISGKDLEIIKTNLSSFAGVYGDGVWALEFAITYNLKLFAGLGFNVFNSVDVSCLAKEQNVVEIAFSKELKLSNAKKLGNKLCGLDNSLIEIMDLIYCPFGKNCNNCSNLNNFVLKDENSREFPVKRYKISECRFKIYNMASLNDYKLLNKIIDKSLNVNQTKTSGNYLKGVK